LQRLEPDAGKLARPVLRGEWRSNVPLLPDKVLALNAESKKDKKEKDR
jgi:hypothetical protein